MKTIAPPPASQHGFFLLEALIALLIFSLGILGMVGMGGAAIAAQSDAQYRTEAANYANEIAMQRLPFDDCQGPFVGCQCLQGRLFLRLRRPTEGE